MEGVAKHYGAASNVVADQVIRALVDSGRSSHDSAVQLERNDAHRIFWRVPARLPAARATSATPWSRRTPLRAPRCAVAREDPAYVIRGSEPAVLEGTGCALPRVAAHTAALRTPRARRPR